MPELYMFGLRAEKCVWVAEAETPIKVQYDNLLPLLIATVLN